MKKLFIILLLFGSSCFASNEKTENLLQSIAKDLWGVKSLKQITTSHYDDYEKNLLKQKGYNFVVESDLDNDGKKEIYISNFQ